MLGDIKNPRWLYIKAALLLMIGLMASALLLIDSPSFRTAALLAAAVWGFCRAYYFAFYVVEKYADPGFKFAGLIAFARYALKNQRHPLVRSTDSESSVRITTDEEPAAEPHGSD